MTILIELKQKLIGRYSRSRGPFRALLQAVITHRVVGRLRRLQRLPQTNVEIDVPLEPSALDVDVMDMEASLVLAFEGCLQRFTGQAHQAPTVLADLADRLETGLAGPELAKRYGLSPG